MDRIDGVKNIVELGKTIYEVASAVPLKDKMELLKRKLGSLTSMASDKEIELAHAESHGKRRKAEVSTWLERVEWVQTDVQQIDELVGQAGMLQRPQLVSRVDERTREVEQLIDQGGFPSGLTLDVEKTESVEFPTCELVGRAFESNKGKILEFLRNDSVFMIGIYGMGGVGKTTLVTHIFNQLRQDGETVHWITVSQECDIGKLQIDLARCLRVDLSDDSDDEKKRAARLSHTLKEKKHIIILDDVWNNYPLEKVGIPDGCKLIMTSRSLDLCRRMGCQKLINVESLPEEEAWQLFKKNLDRRVPFTHEVEEIARSVANECCGLPLAITVLSASMRGVDDIFEWRYVRDELRESRSTECMENEVFRVLRFSYDRLTDKTAKQCFLHFALFPEDYEIERWSLIQHFIDAGLLGGRSSREAAFNRGHAVINKLLGVSLLERGRSSQWWDSVKMHDLVRDMVIGMTKARFLVLSKLGKREIQLDEWTEGLEKISLMDNDISEIPSGVSPRCPKLTVLLLNWNRRLRSIPDEFFKHMPSLQFLDLSGTSIETLPSSVKDLNKMTALYLKDCKYLHDLPALVKLVSLNLDGSAVKTFPTVSQFSHLQYLNLFRTRETMTASELKSLRKLEMLRCHFDEVSEFNAYAEYLNEQDGCVRFYELHLTGEVGTYVLPPPGRRSVGICNCRVDGDILLPRGIESFQVSHLDGPRRSLSDLSSLPLTTFKDLKHCSISKWRSMKCFISLASSSAASIPHGSGSGTILPALEEVELIDLPELRLVVEIIQDGDHHADEEASSDLGTLLPPPQGAMGTSVSMFPRLRRLYVFHCPQLQKLLTAPLLHSLVNLEYIQVLRCESMLEIVASEATEEGRVGAGDGVMVTRTTLPFHLPKLRHLWLVGLPELRSICGNGTVILGGSIETVTVKGCHMLERIPLHLHPLPDGRVSLPPLLRQISIEWNDLSWWESLAWDHFTAKELIRPLLQVDVGDEDSD